MGSSSESSSDDDENEILSLINRNAQAKIKLMAKTPTTSTKQDHQFITSSPPPSIRNSKTPTVPSVANGRITRGDLNLLRLTGDADLDDDFKLDIPSIFQTDAIENERLLLNHEKLERDLQESNSKMKQEYQQLVTRKTAILSELNDNGSIFKYSLNKDRHRTLVESLTKKSLHKHQEFAFKRQFYFFGNVYHLNHQLDCFSDINGYSNIQPILPLATQNKGSIDRLLQHVFQGNLKSLLDYALLKVYDLSQLQKLADYFAHYEKSVEDHHDESVSLSEYMKALGADAQVIDSLSLASQSHKNNKASSPLIPLKIVQYSTHNSLLLLRLSLVFSYFIMNDGKKVGDNHLVSLFHLTIADFNLNSHESNILIDTFIRPVFKKYTLQKFFRASDNRLSGFFESELPQWNCSWHQLYKTYIYQQPLVSISGTKGIQLRYNMLRLLYEAFNDKFNEPLVVHALVSLIIQAATDIHDPNLCERFEKNILKNGGEQLMLKPLLECGSSLNLSASVKTVTKTILELPISSLLDDFELQNHTAINKIFHIYYLLLITNLQLLKTFSKNYNCSTNRAQYAKIKKVNHTNLTKLSTAINKARDNVHHTLSHSLRISSEPNEYYDKDIVVGMTTDIYYVLSYLHNIISKDLRLVRRDIFYDQE